MTPDFLNPTPFPDVQQTALNYRPISLLRIVSKMHEHICDLAYEQLSHF